MYLTKKRFIIVAGIAVVVIVASVFIFILQGKGRQRAQISAEGCSYRTHLEAFLEDSGLTSVRKEKDGFAYYELWDANGDGQGFVFLGEEEGYEGPIRFFVQTDIKEIIQRVHVWEHTETPIYVHPVQLGEFLDTFTAQKIDAELKWQTDIHGLTGATVTAESIIRGVRNLGIRAKEKEIYGIP